MPTTAPWPIPVTMMPGVNLTPGAPLPRVPPGSIPAPMLPAGPLNQYDFISVNHDEVEGAVQSSLMRGTPGFAAAYQRKQIPQRPTVMQQGPIYFHSRPFSRGAGAYSPKFGVLNINPIGSGIDAPYKLPVIAGPGARYQNAAIWFDVQSIPTTIRMSPTMTKQSVDALLGIASVAAMYPTTG